MRVLVLGARGLLGSTLVPAFRRAALDVVTHATRAADICGDLTRPADAADALHAAAPDVVVNLAAATDVDACERDPHHAYLLNVKVVENVVLAMRTHARASHLVQISSDQLYDGPGPHDESAVRITNTYAFSKYAGELAAARCDATIIRTNFVGPSARPGRTSLTDWLHRSLAGATPIRVFDDVAFSPLSIQTLVRYLEMVVRRRESGVFNLGSRGGISKADFAFAFARATGHSTALLQRGESGGGAALAYRPKDMRMISARFEATFGVTTPTLEQEIAILGAEYAAT